MSKQHLAALTNAPAQQLRTAGGDPAQHPCLSFMVRAAEILIPVAVGLSVPADLLTPGFAWYNTCCPLRGWHGSEYSGKAGSKTSPRNHPALDSAPL